jgi:NitT/TauT family transport system substrate-binding protein
MNRLSINLAHRRILAMLAVVASAVAVCGLAAVPVHAAEPLTKVVLGTNWFAQAEHGGFYHAKAKGIYEKYGLDVTTKMGGPQVNALQLLLAGETDFAMSSGVRALTSAAQELPLVTVSTSFQKDPSVIIAHSHVTSLKQLKGRPVLIASNVRVTTWPWLIAKHGYTEDMARPYTFSVAPFLADRALAQQGFVSSEPFAIEQAGVKPKVFLLADFGYPDYAQTVLTTQATAENKPDVVRRFVEATAEGWAGYLSDPAAANELIKKDNPRMTDAQIAFGIAKMKEHALVSGGDAATKGVGVITDARWKQIYEFQAAAGLLPKGLDYKRAYTLEFLPKKPMMAAK